MSLTRALVTICFSRISGTLATRRIYSQSLLNSAVAAAWLLPCAQLWQNTSMKLAIMQSTPLSSNRASISAA